MLSSQPLHALAEYKPALFSSTSPPVVMAVRPHLEAAWPVILEGSIVSREMTSVTVTKIGKGGYTPGLCEMTEMSPLYTRKCQKMPMYDAKLAYTWYITHIPGIYQIDMPPKARCDISWLF